MRVPFVNHIWHTLGFNSQDYTLKMELVHVDMNVDMTCYFWVLPNSRVSRYLRFVGSFDREINIVHRLFCFGPKR